MFVKTYSYWNGNSVDVSQELLLYFSCRFQHYINLNFLTNPNLGNIFLTEKHTSTWVGNTFSTPENELNVLKNPQWKT